MADGTRIKLSDGRIIGLSDWTEQEAYSTVPIDRVGWTDDGWCILWDGQQAELERLGVRTRVETRRGVTNFRYGPGWAVAILETAPDRAGELVQYVKRTSDAALRAGLSKLAQDDMTAVVTFLDARIEAEQ